MVGQLPKYTAARVATDAREPEERLKLWSSQAPQLERSLTPMSTSSLPGVNRPTRCESDVAAVLEALAAGHCIGGVEEPLEPLVHSQILEAWSTRGAKDEELSSQAQAAVSWEGCSDQFMFGGVRTTTSGSV